MIAPGNFSPGSLYLRTDITIIGYTMNMPDRQSHGYCKITVDSAMRNATVYGMSVR